MEPRVDVALVHYPVQNRRGEIIASAVTNLDLHDIARAGRTYGVNRYFVVTPHSEQRELVGQIVGHWTVGAGSTVNPDRKNALSLVRVVATVEDALQEARVHWGERPLLVATAAHSARESMGYGQLRRTIRSGRPVLLLFGTAWGLDPNLLAEVDAVLAPIQGGRYNHLSVRSASSITFDRLLAPERDEGI